MPVLIVSLKTSPQLGFSKNLIILPLSSVITTPYSKGMGSLFNINVALEPFSL